MYENDQLTEKVILVGVSQREDDDTEASLDELSDLAETAGAVTVGRVIQNLPQIHPATYVGSGKLEEIRELIWETDATGIICDDELSPAQMKNMEQALDTKVMDRTLLISGYFCGAGGYQRGKDPGGAGSVKIPPDPPDRIRTFHVPAGRRDRHQGTR